MRNFAGDNGPKHYIAMSGSEGCLPDSCEVFMDGPTEFDNQHAAIEYLVQMFDLTGPQTVVLKVNHILVGGLEGAAYCEVTACDCDTPEIHSDSITPEEALGTL